jgi:hypothetical protein
MLTRVRADVAAADTVVWSHQVRTSLSGGLCVRCATLYTVGEAGIIANGAMQALQWFVHLS